MYLLARIGCGMCSWALTDIKCGMLNTSTIVDAREVARRVGKGGKGLERTCDMTEVVAALDGSHPSITLEEAPGRARALTQALGDTCGGEAALTASAYLVLGSCLHRLGQRASANADVDAKQAWEAALDLVAAPCIEAEALVKVAGLVYISRYYLEKKETAEADKAASQAVEVAEKAMLPDALHEVYLKHSAAHGLARVFWCRRLLASFTSPPHPRLIFRCCGRRCTSWRWCA